MVLFAFFEICVILTNQRRNIMLSLENIRLHDVVVARMGPFHEKLYSSGNPDIDTYLSCDYSQNDPYKRFDGSRIRYNGLSIIQDIDRITMGGVRIKLASTLDNLHERLFLSREYRKSKVVLKFENNQNYHNTDEQYTFNGLIGDYSIKEKISINLVTYAIARAKVIEMCDTNNRADLAGIVDLLRDFDDNNLSKWLEHWDSLELETEKPKELKK
jgi:hypothetical protein